MKKISTRIDGSGKQWDNYKVGDTKIQTCTSKKGDKAVSFAVECTNYAIEVGYKNWSLLAKDMKAEDLEKGICWNCNHIESSLIKVCVECGRKGTSLTGEFKIRNSRVYHG